MAARRQISTAEPDGEFNLATALRACLSCCHFVIGRDGAVLACTPDDGDFLSRQIAPGTRLASVSMALEELAGRAQTTGETQVVPVLVLHGADGAPRQVRATAVPLVCGGESLVILNLADTTRFVLCQKRLAQLDRLATSGTLAASMAHEIKNALVAVKTFVDLLIEKNKDDELAELVQRELARVNTLVRQLLRNGASPQPEYVPVRLHDVLEHSLLMIRAQLSDKLICVNRTFAAAPDVVQGDPQQLEQVFVNLLLNAVEATGPQGSLTVQTECFTPPSAAVGDPARAGQPHVRVSVADTGTGMAPEALARMFEPFFTTKSHGTGLGLLISQRIVQQHHGAIQVESQPNKGTTFRVLLPARPETA